MDIHHAMIIRNVTPQHIYAALTQPEALAAWMDAPVLAQPQVGAVVEFQYDQGQRAMKMEITRLDPPTQLQWRVVQAMWPVESGVDQLITWTLSTPYEGGTLVDFRMAGWPHDDDIYASVSYKWAMFMVRLKVYLGDTRELASLPAAK